MWEPSSACQSWSAAKVWSGNFASRPEKSIAKRPTNAVLSAKFATIRRGMSSNSISKPENFLFPLFLPMLLLHYLSCFLLLGWHHLDHHSLQVLKAKVSRLVSLPGEWQRPTFQCHGISNGKASLIIFRREKCVILSISSKKKKILLMLSFLPCIFWFVHENLLIWALVCVGLDDMLWEPFPCFHALSSFF